MIASQPPGRSGPGAVLHAVLLAVILVAVLGCATLGRPGTASAGGPDDYRQTLQSALSDLDGAGQGVEARVASLLRAVGPITLPDGSSVTPDTTAIARALEARPPDRDDAQTMLRALIAELDRASAMPTAPWRGDPHSSLQRVLDRPEFRPRAPDPLSAYLANLLATALDWLSRALGSVGGPSADSLRKIVPIVGLLIVGGLIAWVIRGLRRAMGPAVVGGPLAPGASARTADEVRAEAETLARAGAYREALRAMCLAAWMRLDEMGKLRFDRTLTNREVLAKIEGQGEGALAELLVPLVERFDRFWYGGSICSRDDYSGFASLAGRVWEGT